MRKTPEIVSVVARRAGEPESAPSTIGGAARCPLAMRAHGQTARDDVTFVVSRRK
jgi:hypothetical protein